MISVRFGQEILPYRIVSYASLVHIRLELVLTAVWLASLESLNHSADPPTVHFVPLVNSFLPLVPQVQLSVKLVMQTCSLLLDLVRAQLIVLRELIPAAKWSVNIVMQAST